MRTRYVGFRVSEDVYEKILYLKRGKTVTQFFYELLINNFKAQNESADGYAPTLRNIEIMVQNINRNHCEQDLMQKLDTLTMLLKMTLDVAVAAAISSPSSTNAVRRKYPGLVEEVFDNR